MPARTIQVPLPAGDQPQPPFDFHDMQVELRCQGGGLLYEAPSTLDISLNVKQTAPGVGEVQTPGRVGGGATRALGFQRRRLRGVALVRSPREPGFEVVGEGSVLRKSKGLRVIGRTLYLG